MCDADFVQMHLGGKVKILYAENYMRGKTYSMYKGPSERGHLYRGQPSLPFHMAVAQAQVHHPGTKSWLALWHLHSQYDNLQ